MIQKAKNPKLKALLKAAQRATEEALHGPPHLRSGQFKPTPEAPKPINKADPRKSKPAD